MPSVIVMDTTATVSEEFNISGRDSLILLDKVAPTDAWTVDRSPGVTGDGKARVWVIDSRATAEDSGIVVAGATEHTYRINLRNGNAGPEGVVGSYRPGRSAREDE